jgi:hypothetical protein
VLYNILACYYCMLHVTWHTLCIRLCTINHHHIYTKIIMYVICNSSIQLFISLLYYAYKLINCVFANTLNHLYRYNSLDHFSLTKIKFNLTKFFSPFHLERKLGNGRFYYKISNWNFNSIIDYIIEYYVQNTLQISWNIVFCK